MERIGTLKRVKPIHRAIYNKDGLTMVFAIEEIEVTRTFNIPVGQPSNRSFLGKLLRKLDISFPTEKSISPQTIADKILECSQGIEFKVKLIPTGKEKFPFNIVDIVPLY